MSLKSTIVLSIAVGMTLLISSAHADFLFGSDAAFSLGSNNYDKFDVLSTNGTGTYNQVLVSLSAVIPPETNIDSIQAVSPTTTIFSIGSDDYIQGTLFHKQDLIVWNGTTATLLWDGQVNGLPPETGINAVNIVALNPLEFSFGLNASTQLTINSIANSQVTKSDVIHWLQGSGFTAKDFDAVAQNIPQEVSLDAFSRINSTQWVMSFDAQALIPATSTNLFAKSDLISYNPSGSVNGSGFNSTPYFNSANYNIPPEANLDAVSTNIGLVPVLDWFKYGLDMNFSGDSKFK